MAMEIFAFFAPEERHGFRCSGAWNQKSMEGHKYFVPTTRIPGPAFKMGATEFGLRGIVIRRYQSLNPLLRSRDFVDPGFQCGKFPKRSRIPAAIIMLNAFGFAV